MERFVEGCLEQSGEDDPDGEYFLWDTWEEGDDRKVVLEVFRSVCKVRPGRRPEDYLYYRPKRV